MRSCPSCGFENADSAKFCPECGTALAVAARALREERKVVTVVFADLVGSTERAERLDPEDVRAILAPYHERLRHELERFGGTVEKFIGDAVVGVFGAPVVHEDDAERAVRAALSIQDAIAQLNEADPRLALEVRIGVNTGEALVALGARPERGEAMVAGDVMNTGARLQAAAPPGAVLVSEPTQRAHGEGDRVRRGRARRGQGQGGADRRLDRDRAEGALRRRRLPEGPWAARRPRARARSRGRRALARSSRARATACHPRRRAGHREEPPRVRAVADRRRGSRADLLATGPFAAVRARGSRSGRSARS